VLSVDDSRGQRSDHVNVGIRTVPRPARYCPAFGIDAGSGERHTWRSHSNQRDVAVRRDELPVMLHDDAAQRVLTNNVDFWVRRSHKQIAHTRYVLTFSVKNQSASSVTATISLFGPFASKLCC
jgi:hypothetical protein